MALNNLRLVFGILYFRLYFDLVKTAPRLDRFVRLGTGVFLFILLFQILQGVFGQQFTKLVFILFFGFLAFFSVAMLAWLFRQLLLKRRRRFSWLLLVIALNFVGVGITSLQYLGWGGSGFGLSDRFLAFFGIANTFFLSPFVIAAFFLEQVLVFNFAVRRYLHLIEKNQKNQLRLAKIKEEGLNALIIGVENERKRIARDLHDGACVNLAAINMKIDSLRETLGHDAGLSLQIAGIAEDLDQTYREVRGISHDLMSKALDATGLQTALEDLIVRVQQVRPGLTVHFFSNYPLQSVHRLAGIHLYRIVQELLANVLKHARAQLVHLQLLEGTGSLLLTVDDDGQGFDPAQQRLTEGIGLSNVRSRVEVLRGCMHIDSVPGKGTVVSIEIPAEALKDQENG
jgi:signal transduction histidine kinase